MEVNGRVSRLDEVPVATQEAGSDEGSNRSDHRVAMGAVLRVGGEDASQLALAEAGWVMGENEGEHGALVDRVLDAHGQRIVAPVRVLSQVLNLLCRPRRGCAAGTLSPPLR